MENKKIITEETVDYVAHLARLEVTPEERSSLTAQMGDILAYVNMLQSLDTSSIEATFQVLPAFNVMREDRVEPSLGAEATLSNAPLAESVQGEKYFKMPKIMETDA